MRKISTKAKIVVASSIALTALGGGVAFGYWSTTGSGSGSSTAASSNGTVDYHVDFDATTLAPGTTVPVTFSATNAGTSDLQVNNPVAVVRSSVAACDAWLHVGRPTQGQTVVPHGGAPVAFGSGVITFDNSLTENQDACKGQLITVSVSSS